MFNNVSVRILRKMTFIEMDLWDLKERVGVLSYEKN